MTSRAPVHRPPSRLLPGLLLFIGLALFYAGLNIWLAGHGYAGDFDQHRWAKVLATLDVDEFRLEHIGLLYPHVPIYLLSMLHSLFGVGSAATPVLLSGISTALLLGLWNRHMRHKGYRLRVRLAMVALFATHPFALWAASSALNTSLAVLFFYVFGYACYLIISVHDVRAVIMAAFLLPILFLTDERTTFVFLALLPLLPFLAPPRMQENSLLSVYSLMGFPLAVAVAGWIYLNWVFHGDPWSFLHATEASFRGAVMQPESTPWLVHWGGQWLAPALIALAAAAMAFPLPLWLTWKNRHYGRRMAAALALFLHPVIAVGLATAAFFLDDMINIVVLLLAATMTVILFVPRQHARLPLLLALLALGNAGGWLALSLYPGQQANAWLQAMRGKAVEQDETLAELGMWLKANPGETLLDDRPLYRAIVARGHARDLVLPFTHQFKNEMKRPAPITPQIVVSHPAGPAAALDRVTQQFPTLFREGLPGYALAFDNGDWRVWRRN
jgi:hypothetical protein